MPIVQLLTFASLVFLQDMCKKLRGMLTEGHPVAWWDINGEVMKKALRRGNEVVHHHVSGHSRGFPWTSEHNGFAKQLGMATMLRTLIAASRPEDFRGARLFSGVAQRFIERVLDRCPSRTPVWNHYILNLKLSEFIPDQCFLKDFGILVHWLLLLKSLFKMMYWWHPYEFDKAGQFQSYGTIRTIRRSTLRQVCGRVLVANRHILLYSHDWASFSSQDFLLLLHAIAAICFISLSHATQNSQRLIAVHFGKLTKKKRLTSTLRNFRRLSTHHVPSPQHTSCSSLIRGWSETEARQDVANWLVKVGTEKEIDYFRKNFPQVRRGSWHEVLVSLMLYPMSKSFLTSLIPMWVRNWL